MGHINYRDLVDEVLKWKTEDLIDVVVTGRRDYVQATGANSPDRLARANFAALDLAIACLRHRGYEQLTDEAIAAGDALNRANVHKEQHEMGLDTFQARMKHVSELLEAGPEERLP